MTDTARLATALGDRYTIERELGAGGMATVYLAHDLKHHRPVAIKVMHPELAAALGSVARAGRRGGRAGPRLLRLAHLAGARALTRPGALHAAHRRELRRMTTGLGAISIFVTASPAQERYPVWSPNGRAILFYAL